MKKLGIIMAFLAILCFGMSSAMAQNTNPAITQFVGQYFPQATVQMVMPDDDDIIRISLLLRWKTSKRFIRHGMMKSS